MKGKFLEWLFHRKKLPDEICINPFCNKKAVIKKVGKGEFIVENFCRKHKKLAEKELDEVLKYGRK